jgi:hypothetical protein
MKVVTFGWEADMIYQHGVVVNYPVLSAIRVKAYQFNVAQMAWKESVFGDKWSEVLFGAGFSGLPAQTEFGQGDMIDTTGGTFNIKTGNVDNGKQNLHGGVNLVSFDICSSILKMFISRQDSVNNILTLSGLDLFVPTGSIFQMTANHAGAGPIDFECQGNLFYEAA